MQHPLSWRRWLVVVAVGELVGFAVPAAAGMLASELVASAQLVVMPVAGLFEGAALGYAQVVVLRRSWPTLRGDAWVRATSLAAAVAWFLGMLPSTTHDWWATWPAAWVAVTATILGTALLATIGTAQALAMPPGTPGRLAWVGWTALGWCAGLTAFSLVAPPLWQPGQAAWLLVLIGVAGGLVMALAMAAVTGVGAVRLVERASRTDAGRSFMPGPHLLSAMLGTPVYDASDDELGRVRDLVADLATDTDHPAITHVVIGTGDGRRAVLPYGELKPRSGGGLGLERGPGKAPVSTPGRPALFLRRDVLDAPVVLAAPPGRTRVSDVIVEIGTAGARVIGVDLTPSGIARRFTGRTPTAPPRALPLSQVHLVSAHGHAAQLAAPDPAVLELPADGMAEVLTRLPVAHAREILRAADGRVREDAVRLLHPRVRARVTGTAGPPRRMRRLSGWRLHRPGTHPPVGGRR